MAVATKVITPEHYYKYKTTFSGAYIDHYYMDMPEDSIRIYEYRDAGTGHAMCVSLPDLKSFFGRHVIYSIEVTFRAVFSPDLYIPEVQFPNTQLPNEGSVPEYIIAPHASVRFFCVGPTDFRNFRIPEIPIQIWTSSRANDNEKDHNDCT